MCVFFIIQASDSNRVPKVYSMASRMCGTSRSLIWFVPFIEKILPIYRAAGGTSYLVGRSDAGRRSKFVEFVWVLMQMLPSEMRYKSLTSFLVWWEANAPAEIRPRKRA